MELQTLLVLCGVGVASVAVVLLMGLFSTSGTSYEEAIAQQRRAATELLALAESKNKPKKSNKKANKKLAKKEKKETATGNEGESEPPAESGVEDDPAPGPKPHVEFLPPVVVDVSRDPPNVKIRKRGKDPKVKPILLNKEDPSCVSDPSAVTPGGTPVANHFEEMHPKDDFELLYSSMSAEKVQDKKEEVVEKKEVKAVKPPKGKAPAKQTPAVEAVKEEVVRERRNSGDAPKEQRKAKKVDKKGEGDAPREEIVPPLNTPQPSELTTEKLLNHVQASAATASPSAGKNKKKKAEGVFGVGDGGVVTVGQLVRVVREASLSRNDLQMLTDALLNMHHDPLPEHSEWSEGPNDPMQKMKKQLADKEKALADELEKSQTLQGKLKELRTSLNEERARATAAVRSGEQAASASRAELHTLQARLQRLLDDNNLLTQEKLMLQTKLAPEGEIQAQRVQMELHIQRLTDTEATLVQQLNALQVELSGRVMEANQARCEAAAARDSGILAQQHANELAQQLQEANHMYSQIEQERQCAVRAEQLAQQELRQVQERLSVVAELQSEVQKLTTRTQSAESVANKLKEEAEKHKQQYSQLTSELASLKEQLAARETELAEVKQMTVVPVQNGLPPSDEAAELAKVESIVSTLREELAAAQRRSHEQRDQLARLQEQLHLYQHKNNEAITKAQESQYREVATILRSAYPAAAPPAGAGRDWLQTFADNLKKELESQEVLRQKEEALEPRLKDLLSQNEYLQSLVDKYKKIIDDTEGVLSGLQQNVLQAEQRWTEQLAEKQRELDDLQLRTVSQLQSKIEALSSELEKAKANHNSSFADAERLTEEKLMMAGLSDKHNADVRNGPLQVGLEEK